MANKLKNNAASKATAKLYLNEKFADVHFVFNVNGKSEKVPANKTRLAVLSPVFETMFYGGIKEGAEVKIVDASAEGFREFLQFFYLDEVTLTMGNIETIARLADKYDVLEYVNACTAFLKSQLNVDNMCWGYQVAIFLKNQELIKFCEEKISLSPKEIFASMAFKQCEQETLEHILKLNLTCNEADIFDSCVKWAKYACIHNVLDENLASNLKNELGDCLKLIRFGEMTNEEFTEIAMSYKGLFTSDEFEDIFFTISSNGKYESKIFNQKPRKYIWNPKKVINCARPTESNTVKKTVQNIEIVSFTSNKPVLLGQFSTQPILTNGGNDYNVCYGNNYNYNYNHRPYNPMHCNVSVTISEIGHFHSGDARKTLHTGNYRTWTGNQLKVELPEPIFIKPQNTYEIRLSSISSNGGTYNSTYKPEVECADGIKIRFHRNQDCSSIDFVSTLCLNKL
ncbi:BTB/POZ domain-containing protein 6-B-like [Contarinia nasturtii]|uniref:BTB/POZ domain-containing protein 6-B-like n=1 Tax=Contarinia nasturtii TaxID=265458 RepID=UPI0012D495BC|nr:BTB/POZ domain-containing protein 6-B-like [Contarinia nasturtii]